MKKQLLFSVCCMLLWAGVSAQVGQINEVPQPLSPEAAELGKYVEMPVGYYSGIPEVGIPLYELKCRDLSVPVSLSYHASGIKRREVPSWVGAGFSLNAGGTIIRIVRGVSDGDNMATPSAYKKYPRDPVNPFPHPKFSLGVELEIPDPKIDGEFDEFYFNFMGYSGSFTFTNYGKVLMGDVNNMKAEYIGTQFKFTDGKGVEYHFTGAERRSYPSVGPYYVTWYLKKIVHPVKRDSIEFSYGELGISNPFRSTYVPSSYFYEKMFQKVVPTVPVGIQNPDCETRGRGVILPQTLRSEETRLLEQIVYNTDTVRFYRSNNIRSDIYRISLDSIRIFDKNGIVHRVKFNYTYSDTLTTDPLAKKMLLKSLKINDQPAYLFSYFESYMGKRMPGIYSNGEDLWGYYNGEDSPFTENNDRIYSNFKSLPGFGNNTSYRNPDYRYAQIGTLKSMTYPTGGKTEFEYEGNDFAYDSYGSVIDWETSGVAELMMDSVRKTGRLVSGPLSGNPGSMMINRNEVLIHHDQTVTINTKIGLDERLNSLTRYLDYTYNNGEGFDGTVRLFKFNSATSNFDLVEERTFNPALVMGLPANTAAFISARPGGTSTESHTRFLTEGRYRVEVEIPDVCMMASMTVTNQFRYREPERIYNAGGLRIKKMKFISPVNNSSFEKSYDYSYKGKTSGILESAFSHVTAKLHWGEVRPYPEGACFGDRAAPQICNFYRFHSEGLIPIGNSKGGAIGYAQVTEQMNDGRKKIMQFTNGYVHQFNDPLFDGFSNGYYYNSLGNVTIIDHKLFDNSVMRGRMKKAEYYNSNGQIIKKEVHTFSDKASVIGANVPSSDSFFYSVGDLVIDGNVCMGNFASLGLYIFTYEVRPKNVVPVLDSVYYYNGNEILKEVTKYAYNSWEYSNPSRIIKTNSIGDTSITHFKYPYDYTISGTSAIAFSRGIKNLQDKHVLSLVESYTEEKPAVGTTKVISAELVSYKPELPVPDTVYSLNNTEGLSNFSPAVFTVSTASKDSRYQRRILFDKYDSYGNVVEQRKDGDLKEVLVWGYRKRYIVARITGSDYNTVIALVDTTVINNPSGDVVLRTELNKIRTALATTNPDAQVTSYTYAALKGMTSLTDPRGETVYYEYDPFGRLKRTKNADNHIFENQWYYYKP